MDPITSIVTALSLGASAAFKETAATAVKDSYAGLKALIQRKYPKVSLTTLEEAPESKGRRAVVEEDLQKTSAAEDPDLLKHTKNMLDVIQQHAPEAGAAIGVDLENIKGASLRISEILATGTGVRIRGADLNGDIEIRQVRAGIGGQSPKE